MLIEVVITEERIIYGSLNVVFDRNAEGSKSARIEISFLIDHILQHLVLFFVFLFH